VKQLVDIGMEFIFMELMYLTKEYITSFEKDSKSVD
jgi:hypothetical protein